MDDSERNDIVELSGKDQWKNGKDESKEPKEKRPSYWKRKKKKMHVATQIECHGLVSLLSASSGFKRIAWATFLGIIIIGLIYEIGKTTYDYYAKPILTSVSLRLEPSMQFPDVYICPLNFLNYSHVLKNDISLKRASILGSNFGHGSKNSVMKNMMTTWQSLIPDITQKGRKVVPSQTDQEYFHDIGYRTSEFLKECYFENREFNCTRFVTEIVDRDHGKCFLISLPNNWHQTAAGLGLSLMMDIHTDLYPPISETHVPAPPSDGIVFSVSHQFDPAELALYRAGPGAHHFFGMDVTEMKLINVEKYTKHEQHCRTGDDATSKVLKAPYSVPSCQMECFQKVIYDKCSCILLMDENFVDPTLLEQHKSKSVRRIFCDAGQIRRCVKRDVLVTNSTYLTAIRDCTKLCYPACTHWKYSVIGSSTPFPSSTLFDAMNDVNASHAQYQGENSPEKLRKDYLILNLAFNELEVREISQSPSMTLDTFIGNLGGHMGIWLGASLITIIQALIMLVEWVVGGRKVARRGLQSARTTIVRTRDYWDARRETKNEDTPAIGARLKRGFTAPQLVSPLVKQQNAK